MISMKCHLDMKPFDIRQRTAAIQQLGWDPNARLPAMSIGNPKNSKKYQTDPNRGMDLLPVVVLEELL